MPGSLKSMIKHCETDDTIVTTSGWACNTFNGLLIDKCHLICYPYFFI